MPKRRANREGSAFKLKDGTWRGYITLGRKDDGSPRRKYFRGKTQKEVQEKIAEVKDQVKKGVRFEGKVPTLGKWVNVWFKTYKAPGMRPTSISRYKIAVDKIQKDAISKRPLDQLRPQHLKNFFNRQGQNLSPSSLHIINGIIKPSLAQAVLEGYIANSPAEHVKVPPRVKPKIKSWSKEEVMEFRKRAKRSRYWAAFELAISLGLRRGEILGLKWDDIDLENGTLTVKRSLVRNEGKIIFNEPKSELSKRKIKLPENTRQVLLKWRKQLLEERMIAGSAYQDNDLVFPNALGKPNFPNALSNIFTRIVDGMVKDGYSRINLHGLRHTCATLSLEAGAPILAVSELLGHYDKAFTLTTYGHVTEQMQEVTASIMDGILEEK